MVLSSDYHDVTMMSVISLFLQISFVSLAAESLGAEQISSIRALRTLRALRPLRAISRWQGMKVGYHLPTLIYETIFSQSPRYKSPVFE